MNGQQPPSPRVLIGTKVDPAFAAQIKAIAASEERTVSGVIRRALTQYAALRSADREFER